MVPWSTELSPGIHAKCAFGDASFTAHPKWDHDTGTLYGWNWRDEKPYVTIHVVRPDGVVQSLDLHDAPYNTVAHDIWLTPQWIVMPFQPFTADRKQITERELGIWGWDEHLPIVLALIPRDLQGEVRWIHTDIPAEYVMHTMSANVDGDLLTLDARSSTGRRSRSRRTSKRARTSRCSSPSRAASSGAGRSTSRPARPRPSSCRTGLRSCRRWTSASTARATRSGSRSAAS